jgi:uncharacterized membrane protein YedE/YeeE
MQELISQPWPWYVAGPLIGLFVPALLLIGNRSFGISSSLRHICAMTVPARISYFRYDWKKELWNLVFIGGILIGSMIAATILDDPMPTQIHPRLQQELAGYGITDHDGMVPAEVMNWQALLTLKGLVLMVGGGFLIGFGTRYAGGCTSGHSIMGLASLQWPSLVATCCFMAGGILMANFVLPLLLSL